MVFFHMNKKWGSVCMHIFSRRFPAASVSNQLFSLFPSRGFCSKHAALLFRRLRFWGGKMESPQTIPFLQPAWLAGKHKMCLLNSLVERGRAANLFSSDSWKPPVSLLSWLPCLYFSLQRSLQTRSNWLQTAVLLITLLAIGDPNR